MAGLQISRSKLGSYKERFARLHTRLKGMSGKTEKVVNQAVHTVEVTAGAFAMGVMNGRNGGQVAVAGVPVDLGAGLAGHLLAFTGVAGSAASHLHAFSDGFLASYAVTAGQSVGKNWGASAASVTGELSGGRGLPDAKAARYAQGT